MISQPITKEQLSNPNFINRSEAINYLELSTYYFRKLLSQNRILVYTLQTKNKEQKYFFDVYDVIALKLELIMEGHYKHKTL